MLFELLDLVQEIADPAGGHRAGEYYRARSAIAASSFS
jgi:hypothetical protein